MNCPLVSIIIPVYNGSNFLAQAIESAINQTYKNIEIIVVNDGSCDDSKTEEVALSYGDKIKYISKPNGGSSSALNTGIKNMTGEYFSWLSHDDLYFSDKIEKQVNTILQSNDNNSIAVASGILINASNEILRSKKNKVITGTLKPQESLKWISHGKGINGCGVLIPKAIIDRVGLFDESFVYLNDLDYWYRIVLENCNLIFTSDIIVKTRIHGQQVSVTKRMLFNNERHKLANKLLDIVSNAKMDQSAALKQIAYFCSAENLKREYARAKKMLAAAGVLNLKLRLYLGFSWYRGLIIRFLKYLRKKIQFHR